jgi:hypothetical protein
MIERQPHDGASREGKRLLTRNHRQEGLSRAYVRAIAARCGMTTSSPDPDYGIDLTINDVETAGTRRFESGYKIDLQVKSATQAGLSGSHLRYDLDVASFDLLRLSATCSPRLLVILLLPRAESRWISQSEAELIMRRCAYWLSLQGEGPTRNRRSVRVNIPRANIFSAAALRAMMNRFKMGGRP